MSFTNLMYHFDTFCHIFKIDPFCRLLCTRYIKFRSKLVEHKLLERVLLEHRLIVQIVDIVKKHKTNKTSIKNKSSLCKTRYLPLTTNYTTNTTHISMKVPVTQHTYHCTSTTQTPRFTHTLTLKLSYAMRLNEAMRMINGNGNKKFLKILYQNVPSQLSHLDKIHSIEYLLVSEKPDVLALAKPSHDDLDQDWDTTH